MSRVKLDYWIEEVPASNPSTRIRIGPPSPTYKDAIKTLKALNLNGVFEVASVRLTPIRSITTQKTITTITDDIPRLIPPTDGEETQD